MISIIFWMVISYVNAATTAANEVTRDEDSPRWKLLSFALHILVPLAGIALLWGQKGIFSKLLLQLDRTCISVYCPSLSKREKLLKWASGRLPSTWSSQCRTLSSGIPELWKDGSLLCTLINSVIPGACPNPHRHWRKPPLHAQALAYKYLGLTPMFTENELSAEFPINQERNFIHYLQKLQEAINKWPTKDELNRKFSSQYVARGMGLYTGEQYKKTVFYIYPDFNTKKRSNVLMYIRGPYGSEGKATISPFHNLKKIPAVKVLQDQLEATKAFPFKKKQQRTFLKTISLDFTSLISSEDNKTIGEIPIQIDMEIDRAKVTYIPNNSGIYEISLIAEGELLRGSPYNVQIIKNSSGKRDSFSAPSENFQEKIIYKKRRILSQIIDCIDEKIFIDNDHVSRMSLGKIRENAKENDDVTITAITKKNDEIMKTEINCSLEEDCGKKAISLDEIAEQLQLMETDNLSNMQINTQHKIVKSFDEAQTKIVDLFQERGEEIDLNLSEAKKLKDFVNSTNKQEMLLLSQNSNQDENNNSSKKPSKRITSKISFELQCKNLKNQLTSPICPNHIVPEVEQNNFNQLPASERRKIFSKQGGESDCAFSCSENEDSSSQSKELIFRELSVLNVLDSLKESRRNSISSEEEPNSLTSTVSLPNILDSSNHFKLTKNYWEKISTSNSSNVRQTPIVRITKYKETTKSVDNLLIIGSESAKHRKYKSMDTSLDDCTIIPIEERKKLLFKDMYEKEKLPTKISKNVTKQINLSLPATIEEPPQKKIPKDIKSQFKRAVKFFKNLEENSKLKSKKKVEAKRRLSLDFQETNPESTDNKGGSLKLPNISQRYSVNNLYEDVFRHRSGSLKGTPNRKEVVNSLSSFLKKQQSNDLNKQEEDNIKYNLFSGKTKPRKRKSLKTLFDVNY